MVCGDLEDNLVPIPLNQPIFNVLFVGFVPLDVKVW